MSEKLLPCPFCGGEAVIVNSDYGDVSAFYVRCGHCYVTTDDYFSEDEAREKWNSRTHKTAKVIGAGFGLIGHCENCGTAAMSVKYKYCPGCGAKLNWG